MLRLKTRYALTGFLVLLGCTSAVTGEKPVPQMTAQPSGAVTPLSDTLTPDESKALEAIPDLNYQPEEILLPNGKTLAEFSTGLRTQATNTPVGPQEAKNALIEKMLLTAENYVNRSKHVYKDGVPEQNGLAYSFGSKNIKRQAPPSGYCREHLRGIDCSGLLYHLTSDSTGLTLPEGNAEKQSQESTWNQAFARSSAYQKLKATRLGAIPAKEMQTGDIIYWLSNNRAYHIGLVLSIKNGGLGVYQSNGTDGSSCLSKTCPAGTAQPCLDEICLKGEEEKNRGLKRGPRTVSLTDPYWFGRDKNYGVLRFTTEINGQWSVSARCAGQTKTILNASILLKDTETGGFKETGSGVDYTGIPVRVSLEGNYDKKQNLLKGTLKLYAEEDTESSREDAFEIRLNEDNTGFIRITPIFQTDACPLELNLINQGK